MFRPGDVVVHTSTGTKMEVARVLPGPRFRCKWYSECGEVLLEHQGEYDRSALVLLSARNDNDSKHWRQRDAC